MDQRYISTADIIFDRNRLERLVTSGIEKILQEFHSDNMYKCEDLRCVYCVDGHGCDCLKKEIHLSSYCTIVLDLSLEHFKDGDNDDYKTNYCFIAFLIRSKILSFDLKPLANNIDCELPGGDFTLFLGKWEPTVRIDKSTISRIVKLAYDNRYLLLSGIKCKKSVCNELCYPNVDYCGDCMLYTCTLHQNAENFCAVCQNSENRPDMWVMSETCYHKFHNLCYRENKRKGLCPLCRQKTEKWIYL
jgi:hypothetical protein